MIDDLIFEKDISFGNSCTTHLYVNENGDKFLVKKFKKKVLQKSIEKEIDILQKIKHIEGTSRYVSSGERYIILEYEEGIELFELRDELIKKNKHPKIIKKILKQIARIMEKVHDADIIHRDLKMENIIFNRETKKVTIIDWGGSYHVPYIGEDSVYNANVSGTSVYISPEVFRKEEYLGNLTKANDVWSYGILFFMMVSLKEPYAITDKELFEDENQRFDICYSKLKTSDSFFLKMIFVEQEERLTFSDITFID